MAPDDDEAGGQDYRLGQGRRLARPRRVRVPQPRVVHHGRWSRFAVLARLVPAGRGPADAAGALPPTPPQSPECRRKRATWRRGVHQLTKICINKFEDFFFCAGPKLN